MSNAEPFKERLIGALRSAVGYFNVSGDPNSAVVKAAVDNAFNVEQTTRLAETFNVARTLYHYKSAADRSSSFALADIDVVLASFFGESGTARTGTVKSARAFDYSEYDKRERDYRVPDGLTKLASDLPRDPPSFDTVSRQAMSALRGLRQSAKIASDEAGVAAYNAERSLRKLAESLTRGDDAAALDDRYARLFLGYKNGEWAPVISELDALMPKRSKAPNAAFARYARTVIFDDRDLGPHLELMKEARDMMETETEFRAVAGQFSKEADDFERAYMLEILPRQAGASSDDTLAAFAFPDGVKLAQSPHEGARTPDKPGKSDSPVSGALGSVTRKPLQSYIETGVERAFSAPVARENVEISERLKNVQRQIMLQDLLVNDPVLSEEAPEVVAEAYSALLQLTPEVAGNKEVVRAILRQTVNAVAVSPYDAEVWTKLEGNLRNIRGKGQPISRPGDDRKAR